MFGCFDSYLVYGFKEGNRDESIDYDWLYDNWPYINKYAIDVVRCYLGEAAYGIACKIDDTGKINISEEDKKTVELFYKEVKEYKKNNDNLSELGFFTAMTGDYSSEHDIYTLNNEEEDEDEDEDEEKKVKSVRKKSNNKFKSGLKIINNF